MVHVLNKLYNQKHHSLVSLFQSIFVETYSALAQKQATIFLPTNFPNAG